MSDNNTTALALGTAALGISIYTYFSTKAYTSKRSTIPGSPFYNGAQNYGGVVYTAGQVGMLPGTKTFAEGGIEAQTKQALENLKAALEKSGSSLGSVLKVTVLLDDIDDYGKFNDVYLTYFTDADVRPARVCFGPGGLPFGALVEIDATAIQES